MGKSGERTNLKDVGVGEMIILKWVFKKYDGGMDGNHLAQVWICGGLLWTRR